MRKKHLLRLFFVIYANNNVCIARWYWIAFVSNNEFVGSNMRQRERYATND
jgi:hypothetical protein